MRIEGTYTFQAPAQRVYSALTSPDVLQHVLPQCQRLIQLGPPTSDGVTTFEARACTSDGIATYSFQTVEVRPPRSLHIAILGPGAPKFAGARARVELAEVEQNTAVTFSWELPTDDECTRSFLEAAIQQLYERLGETIRSASEASASEASASEASASEASGQVSASRTVIQTSRGRIVALPAARRALTAQRVTWLSAGLLLAMGCVAVALALVRHDEETLA